MAKTYLGEIKRKLFHLTALLVPILYTWVPWGAGMLILLGCTAISVTIDLFRRYSRSFERFFDAKIAAVLREHERRSFTGSTWILVASTLCVFFFPKPIAQAAVTYIVFGDVAAALIGRPFGKHRFPNGKSLEGTLSFFVFTTAAGFVIPGLTWPLIVVGALVGALVEVAPIPLDDNLTVPIAVGIAMVLMSMALGLPLI